MILGTCFVQGMLHAFRTALECVLFRALFNPCPSCCTIPSVSQADSEAQQCSTSLGAVWADTGQVQKLTASEELGSCKLFPVYYLG